MRKLKTCNCGLIHLYRDHRKQNLCNKVVGRTRNFVCFKLAVTHNGKCYEHRATEGQLARKVELQRKRRAERLAAGLCQDCGREPASGSIRGQNCRLRESRSYAIKRLVYIA